LDFEELFEVDLDALEPVLMAVVSTFGFTEMAAVLLV